MDITIQPGTLSGTVNVISSKSLVHRYLICAAFADIPTELVCSDSSKDIEATVQCLNALGSKIVKTASGYHVQPIRSIPAQATLFCGESGSTLRFLLPIAGALGVDATFCMEGRLPERPLSPLWEEMERMGCSLSRPAYDCIRCTGQLQPGNYKIDGNISSQFISGLLFALELISGSSYLEITGKVESVPYINMTRQVLAQFQVPTFTSRELVTIEGDWSNGAFWLAANALGSSIRLTNLAYDSIQGDRAISDLLQNLNAHCVIDVSDNPDLVPILAIVAATKSGACFTNIQRLRLKESDRVASTVAMINSMGGKAEVVEDTMQILGTGLTGGTVDSQHDHRIAMAAAIGATVCSEPITILGAEAVEKSYSKFWEEYRNLGGKYEQHLR